MQSYAKKMMLVFVKGLFNPTSLLTHLRTVCETGHVKISPHDTVLSQSAQLNRVTSMKTVVGKPHSNNYQ